MPHVAEPIAEYVPAEQAVHASEPAPAKVPVPQSDRPGGKIAIPVTLIVELIRRSNE